MLKVVKYCKEYSIPLILGVVVSVIWANTAPESYETFVYTPIAGETISLHMIINDVFMVFFFAIAGVEIINSMGKGGALNPVKKAVTPLLATVGGVVTPIAVFFILNAVMGSPEYANGWGICTATDIAMAWLFAKLIFGKNHPAISFLLLLAVVDDAIGLVIIAVFYPAPGEQVQPQWLLLVAAAMLLAWGFRKIKIRYFEPYVLICGTISWIGMHQAHLHPALALVFIIPFLPRTGRTSYSEDEHGVDHAAGKSALHTFETRVGTMVDFGMFFFGLTNAGVGFSSVSGLTLIIFLAFLIGKSLGVCLFTFLAVKLKAQLPQGMKWKDVLVTGVVAGMGLTVALFITENAFTSAVLQGAAKMGALCTVFILPVAFVLSKAVGVQRINEKNDGQ